MTALELMVLLVNVYKCMCFAMCMCEHVQCICAQGVCVLINKLYVFHVTEVNCWLVVYLHLNLSTLTLYFISSHSVFRCKCPSKHCCSATGGSKTGFKNI